MRFAPPRALRVLAAVLLVAVAAPRSAPAQVVNLNPGQFTGRIRIGSRDILACYTLAESQVPIGYSSAGSLNGTDWNGTDFSGPQSPDGFTLSAQALDPATGNNIIWQVRSYLMATSSGLGDTDMTFWPFATGQTVDPDAKTVVEFVDPGWIVDAEVTNGGCPSAAFMGLHLEAVSTDWPNAGGFTSTDDSQEMTSGQGQAVRFTDIPVFTGHAWAVSGTAYLSGADVGAVYLPVQYFSASDVDADGHVHLAWTIYPGCAPPPVCTAASVSGVVTLNGSTAPETFDYNVACVGGAQNACAALYDNPDAYDFDGLRAGWYLAAAYTNFNGLSTFLQWPFSAATGFDTGYYFLLDCPGERVIDWTADVAFNSGTLSWTCAAKFEPRIVVSGGIFSDGMHEGLNPADNTYLGSYGGQATDTFDLQTGNYRMVVVPGSWNTYHHSVGLYSNNPSDPDYPEYTNQQLYMADYRVIANAPSDPTTLHAVAGQDSVRNFSYEMGKLIVDFTITGSTPAARQLRSPYLEPYGAGALTDASGTVLYTAYSPASGTTEITETGKVTMYLPKGDYCFTPFAYRVLDGSLVSFPRLCVTIACGTTEVDLHGPQVEWVPLPDACADAQGALSGTAQAPDGFGSASYRVNFATPGPGNPAGYTPLTLLPTGGSGNEVSFSDSVSFNAGPNTVELEAVDALGRRFYEQRTVYGSDGSNPTLDWTFPQDGTTTAAPAIQIQVQGHATSSVKITSITVNGTSVTLTPIDGPDLNARSFDHPYTLMPGTNVLLFVVTDACGYTTSESRTVTLTTNGAPQCDAGADVAAQCDGVTLDASATDPDGDSLLFAWSSSCAQAMFSPSELVLNPTVTFGSGYAGDCTLTLSVSDGQGGACEDTVLVEVDAVPPVANAGPDRLLTCASSTVVLAGSAGGGNGTAGWSYSWSPANALSDPFVAMPTTSAPGVYTLLVTDLASGCTHEDTVAVTQDIVAPLGSAGADTSVSCTLPVATLSGAAMGGNGSLGYAFAWTPAADVSDPALASTSTAIAGTYTLTVTDLANGCSAQDTVRVVQLNDTTPPGIACPAAVNVQCAAAVPAPDPASVAATDDCPPAPTVTFVSDVTTGQTCPSHFTVSRTYRAIDASGNSADCVQTITVNDTSPPVVTCPPDLLFQCAVDVPAPNEALVGATDNCSPAPTVTHVGDVIVNQTCANRFTLLRTYRATDACLNTTDCTQSIVVSDTLAPVPLAALVPLPPAPPTSATSPSVPLAPGSACSAPVIHGFTAWCAATDNCDPAPLVNAVLVVTNHDVSTPGGPCVLRVERLAVDCGEVLEIRLVAAPCPAKPPKSARQALSVRSDGTRVFAGERVVLEVTATDHCGNTAIASHDPTTPPLPPCEHPLLDGSCCPAIQSPPPENCHGGPCS